MDAVRFSVVIPTRERAETLRHALRTCINQNFDDFEIIVSDNDSSPATKAVVDEAACPKVRYVRTPGPLAMSSNWDFAVSHARGEFVVLIGDDDGLLPHALAELDNIIREKNAKVVRWEPAYYTWPSFALAGQGDYLRIPLGRGLREIVGLDAIRAVIGFRSLYTTLPMLYNSAVHRSVLDELKAKTGRVFPHPVPDVYSGFAVAAVAGKFWSTEVAMSVAGQSGASNGIAVLFNRGRSAIDREFRTLNAREGLVGDPRIPDLPVFPHVPVAASFAYAKQKLFSNADIDLDRKQFVTGCIANLRVATEGDWGEALRVLRESLADDRAMRDWFDAECASAPFREPTPPLMKPDRLGFDGEYLHINATEFGVVDVAGAANLCERLLSYQRDSVRYVGPLLQELRRINVERQGVVEGLFREVETLRKTCDERLALIRTQHNMLSELERQARGGIVKRAARWAKRRVKGLLRPATKT